MLFYIYIRFDNSCANNLVLFYMCVFIIITFLTNFLSFLTPFYLSFCSLPFGHLHFSSLSYLLSFLSPPFLSTRPSPFFPFRSFDPLSFFPGSSFPLDFSSFFFFLTLSFLSSFFFLFLLAVLLFFIPPSFAFLFLSFPSPPPHSFFPFLS